MNGNKDSVVYTTTSTIYSSIGRSTFHLCYIHFVTLWHKYELRQQQNTNICTKRYTTNGYLFSQQHKTMIEHMMNFRNICIHLLGIQLYIYIVFHYNYCTLEFYIFLNVSRLQNWCTVSEYIRTTLNLIMLSRLSLLYSLYYTYCRSTTKQPTLSQNPTFQFSF